jgi:hypothetical protein
MKNQGMTLAQGMKLKRVIRNAKDLRDSLQDRLDQHHGGECEARFKCHIEKNYTRDRHETTATEYYKTECPQGQKLADRLDRQKARIKNLENGLGIFARVEIIQVKGR